MDEETNETVEQGCVPCFIDGEGNEVHIGDLVSWTNKNANGSAIKAGRVLGINWMSEGCNGLKCMVKVKGSANNINATKLVLMDGETLDGKLRRLVAACEGKMKDSAIAAIAAEIEEMYGVEPSDGQGDGE